MNEKICVFNFGGLFWIAAMAFASSLLISLDAASASGSEISTTEFLRAFVATLFAVAGFFTHRRVEKEVEQ